MTDIPDEIMKEHKLQELATTDGYVLHCKITKSIYGLLPQAGIIAQELLEKQLEKYNTAKAKSSPACGNMQQDQQLSCSWLTTLQ